MSQTPKDQGWQPIETAPKDALLLVWTEDGCADIALTTDGHMWWSNSDQTFCFPTHWMPLPAPPVDAKAGR